MITEDKVIKSFCVINEFYKNFTQVRDNFSMKRVPTALIFPHIQAVPPAYSQKTICSKGRT